MFFAQPDIPIVSITARFSFRKCVNAHIETVCMKNPSMHLLSMKDDLSVVCSINFSGILRTDETL